MKEYFMLVLVIMAEWNTEWGLIIYVKHRKLRNYNVGGDENPQRVNEMNSPSFESFLAHLDCELTYGNKNQTPQTLV